MSGARRRARLPAAAAALALLVAVAEGGSALAIALVGGRLDEPIRRTADVFREQGTMLQALLEPRPRLLQLDPALGWRYAAGFSGERDHTSVQGLRASRVYDPSPPPGVLRVAAFGDSFVYGNEVADSAAWPAVLEALDPGIEVLNHGVGGYGTDQAYLHYLEVGDRLSPHVVLIGFVADDLGRLVNVYRRFLSTREQPLFKPRFRLDAAGGLVLVPNPMPGPDAYRRLLEDPGAVRAYGAADAWYEPLIYENPLYDWSATVRLATSVWIRARRRYIEPGRTFRGGVVNPSSPAFALQVAIFDAFAEGVRRNGAVPVLVFFPDRHTVAQRARGRAPSYLPLADRMRGRGATVLDAVAAFPAGGRSADWFMPGGHYSPEGNRLVAQWLREQLRALDAAGPGDDIAGSP